MDDKEMIILLALIIAVIIIYTLCRCYQDLKKPPTCYYSIGYGNVHTLFI